MKAAIYIRYSSHNQDGNLTVEIQNRRCREFIAGSRELAGCEVLPFIDAAATGATFNRPEFQRMAAQIRARQLSAVVVYKYDRLGRDALESERYNREFAFAGAPVFSATEPAHDLSRWVLAGVAEEFRRQLGQRCQDALRQNAEAGWWNGAAPYGYQLRKVRVNDGKRGQRTTLEIDPAEADVVRRIFKLAASRVSLRNIALQLNADGIKSPRGLAWDNGGVRSVLVNPIYSGRRVALRWTRRRGPDGRRIQQQRPASEWSEQLHDEWRIIAERRFETVREIFAARRRAASSGDGVALARASAPRKPGYLMSGVVRCATCGGLLQVQRGATSRKQPVYELRCSAHHRSGPTVCTNARRYPVQPVEDYILAAIEEQVIGPQGTGELLRILEKRAQERYGDRAGEAGERRRARLDAEIGRLVEAVASAGGPVQALTDAIRAKEAERARLAAELSETRTGERRLQSVLAEARRELASFGRLLAGVVTRALQPTPLFRAWMLQLVPSATLDAGAQLLHFQVNRGAVLEGLQLATPTGFETAEPGGQVTDTPGTNQAQTEEPRGVADRPSGHSETPVGHPKDAPANAACCAGVAQTGEEDAALEQLHSRWSDLSAADHAAVLARARLLAFSQDSAFGELHHLWPTLTPADQGDLLSLAQSLAFAKIPF